MKKKLFFICSLVLLVALGFYMFDTRLETTFYSYTSAKVPSAFNGFRIVQLSDFHLKQFGEHEETLIAAIEACLPDIILLTGDTVDESHTDLTPLEDLLKGISKICPVYSVTGNHDLVDAAADQYAGMQALFQIYAVTDMDDSSVSIQRGDSLIRLSGGKWCSDYIRNTIPYADTQYFNIYMYHGSNFFDLISGFGYDLIFSGHQHGGIIRLPLIGGLFSADHTLFPEYSGGIYQKNNSVLICNRGLGDSIIPRVFNRPEIVCLTLYSD